MRGAVKVVQLFLVAVLIVVLNAGVGLAAPERIGGDNISLQILTVNDFHGALIEEGKNPGAAKLAQYLKSAKASAPATTLILCGGDMFQGTAQSNLLGGEPVVEVMNNIGFDAMTIGNHEYDWGIDVLKQRIKQSQFPYVSANILDKNTGKNVDYAKPYIIVKRAGLKIAIVGMATPETATKTNPKIVSGYLFQDPTKAMNTLMPELKRQRVDLVVVLSHLGSFGSRTGGKVTGEAADLAQGTSGIAAIVSAHSHQFVAGEVNGVPIVQAGSSGKAVGKINLVYSPRAKKVVSAHEEVVSLPYNGLGDDPEVKSIVDKAQAEVAPVVNEVLGRTVNELSNNHAANRQSILGQWSVDAMRDEAKTDIAFSNSGGLRTSIPAGNITMGKIYEVMPFDNTLVTMEMSGAQVMEVLEHGIGNNEVGTVLFSGIRVQFDATRPEGQKVVSVTMLDGTPLDASQTYKIVVNDFMASGGDGYTTFKEGRNAVDTYKLLRDIMANTIRKAKVIDFKGDDRLALVSQMKMKRAA